MKLVIEKSQEQTEKKFRLCIRIPIFLVLNPFVACILKNATKGFVNINAVRLRKIKSVLKMKGIKGTGFLVIKTGRNEIITGYF